MPRPPLDPALADGACHERGRSVGPMDVRVLSAGAAVPYAQRVPDPIAASLQTSDRPRPDGRRPWCSRVARTRTASKLAASARTRAQLHIHREKSDDNDLFRL